MAFRVLVVAGAIAAVAVTAGCTATAEPSNPEASSAPSPSRSAADPEEAVLEAYEGMWNVVIDASHAGEADPDELGDYASGDALALMQQTLQGASDDGVTVVGEPVMDPEITDMPDPETVTILDCMDDSQWVEPGGETSTEEVTGPRKIDATATYDGLTWRISEMRIWEKGSC